MLPGADELEGFIQISQFVAHAPAAPFLCDRVEGREAGGQVRRVRHRHRRSRARVTFAQGLLTNLGNKLSAGVLTRKLMMFAVGADNRLDLEYLKDHDTIRVIGWRENEERDIGDALAKLRGGGKVAQGVRERLEEVINRSVILVAVPCPLPEGAP